MVPDMVNQWPFGPGLCHVFDIVSERVLPNKKLSAREQTSLQGALLLALKNAEDLRAVIITTYIANAQANGCKLDIRYPDKRPDLSRMVARVCFLNSFDNISNLLIASSTKLKLQRSAAPALEYPLRLIFKSANLGAPNRKPARFKYPRGDSTTQQFLSAQLKWLPK